MSQLGPVEIVLLPSGRSKLSAQWNALLDDCHYLGAGPLCGEFGPGKKPGRPALLVRAERNRLLTQEQGHLWEKVGAGTVAGHVFDHR